MLEQFIETQKLEANAELPHRKHAHVVRTEDPHFTKQNISRHECWEERPVTGGACITWGGHPLMQSFCSPWGLERGRAATA